MKDANPVRLLILGLLAGGPMHGHQIRRTAEMTGVENWGGVKVGALYGMLHRLESEGLVNPVRTEQSGNRPRRTVYAITNAGRSELAIHRDRALTQPVLHSTTVSAALKWPSGLDAESLSSRLTARRTALAAKLTELRASRELHEREGHLSAASLAGYRRSELQLEAELAWHDELDHWLPAIAAGDDRDRAGSADTDHDSPDVSGVTPLRRRSSGAS